MTVASDLTEHLYRALSAPIGIVVKTNDTDLLRNRLYTARRQAQDPQLESLSILFSRTNPKGEVWIVKKDAA